MGLYSSNKSLIMLKILEKINVEPILKEYYSIQDNIQWTSYNLKGKQCSLQYRENEDPWTSSVGRSKGEELSYGILNDFFKNTIFETIIRNYNLKRTRLMWLEPYSCYSMHNDETPRIHIPLITNQGCYFLFKIGLIKHLEIGNVYWVDTRKLHTFVNTSEYARLHLVGIVES